MYKAGQGMPSRVGAMIVGVLVAFYASSSWFRWQPFSAIFRSDSFFNVDFVISVVFLAGLCVFFAWMAFRAAKSGDYLIDMDDELRKVVWPSVMPLFDPKTEAWGSTYVVIVCSIIFTFFIWIADLLLRLVITDGIFGLWLFA